MAYYAHYDPTITENSHVNGWYDTTTFNYASLPPTTELFELTSDQWSARTKDPNSYAVTNGVLVDYVHVLPELSIAQQAALLIANGLTITSTSTPDLNGIYSASTDTITYINSEVVSIILSGTFTGGATTLQWADKSGILHTFPNTDVFKGFATAMGTFVNSAMQCEIGASTTLPASTIIIP